MQKFSQTKIQINRMQKINQEKQESWAKCIKINTIQNIKHSGTEFKLKKQPREHSCYAINN